MKRSTLRGQTTLDFAIAMGVFLLTIAFVFTFIPSLTAPFVDGNQEHTVVADRVSSHIVEGGLAEPDKPYVLNVACTTPFFGEDGDPPDVCGYPESNDFRERIGVGDRPNVNITLVTIDASTRERTLLCDDGDGNVVPEDDCDPQNGGQLYQIGPEYSHAKSITAARRIVSIDDRDATLFVRVW